LTDPRSGAARAAGAAPARAGSAAGRRSAATGDWSIAAAAGARALWEVSGAVGALGSLSNASL
jgi:hypothetical protein